MSFAAPIKELRFVGFSADNCFFHPTTFVLLVGLLADSQPKFFNGLLNRHMAEDLQLNENPLGWNMATLTTEQK